MAASLAVLLAGCSSSGGGTVDRSALIAKLKTESEITSITSSLPGSSGDAVVSCIADALQKDGDSGDINKYVAGKIKLDDISAKSKGASDQAATDAENCTKAAVSGAATAAPSS